MVRAAAIGVILAVPFLSLASESSNSNPLKWDIQVDNPVPKKSGTQWGINVGAYFPVDSEIRDAFGSILPRIGISPVSRKFDKRFDMAFDVNVLWADNSDGEHLFLLPVTFGAVLGFGSGGNQGFISANAGPAYYDYDLFRNVGKGTSEFRSRKIGWNANIEVGLLLEKRLSITGRYDWYSKSDDFDFSGFSVNITYAILRW